MVPVVMPERAVDAAHELGLVRREVVVDRDDVDALAGDRVEVGREGRGQGLALTGLHLGDVAEVKRRAAHDLDVVGALAERALGRLADGRERLGHELVERRAGLVAGTQFGGLAAQLVVGELRVVLFEGVDRLDDLLKPSEDAALAGAKQFLERVGHEASPSVGCGADRRRCRPSAWLQAYLPMLSARDLGMRWVRWDHACRDTPDAASEQAFRVCIYSAICIRGMRTDGEHDMSVRQSLLAILDQGPCYGYQLRAEFDRRTGSTWPLNVGQIYNTLDRLERDGLVAKGDTDAQGHVYYAITDAGSAEVAAWLASPVERGRGHA